MSKKVLVDLEDDWSDSSGVEFEDLNARAHGSLYEQPSYLTRPSTAADIPSRPPFLIMLRCSSYSASMDELGTEFYKATQIKVKQAWPLRDNTMRYSRNCYVFELRSVEDVKKALAQSEKLFVCLYPVTITVYNPNRQNYGSQQRYDSGRYSNRDYHSSPTSPRPQRHSQDQSIFTFSRDELAPQAHAQKCRQSQLPDRSRFQSQHSSESGNRPLNFSRPDVPLATAPATPARTPHMSRNNSMSRISGANSDTPIELQLNFRDQLPPANTGSPRPTAPTRPARSQKQQQKAHPQQKSEQSQVVITRSTAEQRQPDQPTK